jgi:hypothetical protein
MYPSCNRTVGQLGAVPLAADLYGTCCDSFGALLMPSDAPLESVGFLP